MGNDLEVSTGQGQIAVKEDRLPKRLTELERGGYYDTVKSPEEYIGGKTKDRSSETDDLELTKEVGLKESEDSKSEIVPLKHWNTKIQKQFDECTESQKEAWIDSFKIIEKAHAKQLNMLKDQIEKVEPCVDLIESLSADLEKLGKTPVEYISALIEYDKLIGQNPTYEAARLISVFGINYDDLYKALGQADKDITTEATLGKYLDPLKKELARVKSAVGYKEGQSEKEAKAEAVSDDLTTKITAFYEQTDSEGKPRYPDAFDHISEIIELVQTGENLQDAYDLVINGERQKGGNDEVEYEGQSDSRKDRPLTAKEKERNMLLNMMRKLER
jgi:hypothetical protein